VPLTCASAEDIVGTVTTMSDAERSAVPPRRTRYDADVLAQPRGPRRRIPEVEARPGLVVEDAASGFCGAVVGGSRRAVTLADRFGRERSFPLEAARFLIDGAAVTLIAPRPAPVAKPGVARTASGSRAVPSAPPRVARAGRIWVEGDHDAALLERIWGDDLRVEGVVVEPIRGVDELPALVREFGPSPQARLGVLVDHLVPGSKESRIAAQVGGPNVLVTGHPYVDIWEAVKPAGLGLSSWPTVPRGTEWRAGVAAALGFADPREVWRRALAQVNTFADVEVPLLRAVEELIDFVTVGGSAAPTVG
jgi:hypothetical protein